MHAHDHLPGMNKCANPRSKTALLIMQYFVPGLGRIYMGSYLSGIAQFLMFISLFLPIININVRVVLIALLSAWYIVDLVRIVHNCVTRSKSRLFSEGTWCSNTDMEMAFIVGIIAIIPVLFSLIGLIYLIYFMSSLAWVVNRLKAGDFAALAAAGQTFTFSFLNGDKSGGGGTTNVSDSTLDSTLEPQTDPITGLQEDVTLGTVQALGATTTVSTAGVPGATSVSTAAGGNTTSVSSADN
jgi:TM2 domain-containing membrane protein YozV